MFSLSQSTGYAIHALSYLDECDARPRMVGEVARLTGIPPAYLAKIVPKLASSKILASKRGRSGGICLVRPAQTITLLEIVQAVEGQPWIASCLLGLDDCASRGICPTKIIWGSIRNLIEEVLRNTTLADVIAHRTKTNPEPPASTATRPCTKPTRRPNNNRRTVPRR